MMKKMGPEWYEAEQRLRKKKIAIFIGAGAGVILISVTAVLFLSRFDWFV